MYANQVTTLLCKLGDYTVQIIQVLPNNATATVCSKKETEWLLKLLTAFPYGLNDKIEEEYQRDSDTPLRISFPSLQIKNKGWKNQPFSKNNSVKSILNLCKRKLKKDLKSCLNFVR